jgi:AraC-like DNA-binding protein
MRNSKNPEPVSQQFNSDENQKNDLLRIFITPSSNTESTPCRLESLKQLYYFKLAEEDDYQNPDSGFPLPDSDIEQTLGPGMHGDDFCKKYCVEKSLCGGSIIILSPKIPKRTPGDGMNLPADNLSHPVNPETSRQHLSMHSDVSIEEQAVLSGEPQFLKNTLALIEAGYKDYKFSVEYLASKLNRSVSQLNRKLNALTGHPAGYLIRLFRLQRSAQMLMEGNKNISEICFETGFNSLSYFCRSFKKEFGFSPTAYRKAMAEKLNIMRKKDN